MADRGKTTRLTGTKIAAVIKSDGSAAAAITADAAIGGFPIFSIGQNVLKQLFSWRDRYLGAKFVEFIDEIEEYPAYNRVHTFNELTSKKSDEEYGSILLHRLDSSESLRQARWLGRCFAARVNQSISIEEHERISTAISRLPPFVIDSIELREQQQGEENRNHYFSPYRSLLLGAGCATVIGGGGLGSSAQINVDDRSCEILALIRDDKPIPSPTETEFKHCIVTMKQVAAKA